ncbi:hypothetical protein K505DRAFT_248173 [Melanomma pulvis-pyrius CBS 109.77]|uniref:Uncharacterized protein n=1 Tax=Melanomma pulvis-pyrius CBS 109.77 TaxID=1314802 RepID=A0A6A6X608_9PLEO|nr:hypothetical protein K505DRAFT_248173 [Melanomma pulvis-pyrius CBS 109.77]
MVSNKKRIEMFIDDIPNCKLEGDISAGTIHSDENLRLDLQSACPIQVNSQCQIRSMRLMTPWTVAKCLAPVDNPWTAQQIKDVLKASNQCRPLK